MNTFYEGLFGFRYNIAMATMLGDMTSPFEQILPIRLTYLLGEVKMPIDSQLSFSTPIDENGDVHG